MITVFDANNYAQQVFFARAFEEVKDSITGIEAEAGRFLSLDGYFAHIKTLIDIEPEYAMIPSDEKPFEINANARTITVPADFVKCAGVAGDTMAEIATFTIDRYFDYVDLATTDIFVMWSAPRGEGITKVGLIDLETIPGKIRFGWPLTGDITAAAGNVTFAVRFAIPKQDEPNKYHYVLNTLNATLTIRPSINLIEGDGVEIDIQNPDFGFIVNSTDPSYPIPQLPRFTTPGTDLEAQYKLVDNIQTMKVQAVVNDNGQIIYKWFYKEDATPAEQITRWMRAEEYVDGVDYFTYDAATGEYLEANPSADEDFRANTYYYLKTLTGVEIVGDGEVYKVDNEAYEVTKDAARVGSKQYYYRKAENEKPVLYIEKDFPTDGTEILERYSVLDIKDSDAKITGLYWVTAENKLTDSPNSNKVAFSKTAYMATPATLVLEKDLAKDVFLKDGKAVLSVEVNKDGSEPTRSYFWYNGDSAIADNNQNSYEVTEPGFYSVDVESELNRTTEKVSSSICRVVNAPAKPVLTGMKYAAWKDMTTIGELDFKDYDNELEVQTESVVRFKITTDLDGVDDKLITDELIYRWFIKVQDGEDIEITSKGGYVPMESDLELGTNEIDIRMLNSNEIYQLYCEVTNKLANEISEPLDEKGYEKLFVLK